MAKKATAASAAEPTTVPKPVARRAAGRVPRPAKASASAGAKPAKTRPTETPQAEATTPKSKATPAQVRVKLIRDSFTMPEFDFLLIARLKQAALEAKRETKKSELLRAGLRTLAAMDAKALVAVLNALEPIKVGRPRKGH